MSDKSFCYNFPKIKGLDHWDCYTQLSKIEEELEELREELVIDNFSNAAIEAMDVIVATETLLRMLPEDMLAPAAAMVIAKNKERGYWVEGDKE